MYLSVSFHSISLPTWACKYISTSWHLPTMLHHSLVPRLLSSFSAKYCALDQFIIVSHRLPPWIFCSTFCSTFCNTICYLHIISNVKWMRDSVMSLVMNVTLTQGSNRLPKTRYCYKINITMNICRIKGINYTKVQSTNNSSLTTKFETQYPCPKVHWCWLCIVRIKLLVVLSLYQQ